MSRSYEPNDNKRGFVSVIDEETKRKLWEEAKEATPDHVLETQLMDSRIPKDELAHYAKEQIEKLRAENERLSAQVKKLGAQLSWWQDADPIIKDAARYQWCVQRVSFYVFLRMVFGDFDRLWDKAKADAAIDEARKDGS